MTTVYNMTDSSSFVSELSPFDAVLQAAKDSFFDLCVEWPTGVLTTVAITEDGGFYVCGPFYAVKETS